MRKILFAGIAGLFCICTACNNAPTANNGMSNEEQKNLAASQTITNAFKTGDVSGIDSVVADNFLDHTDRGDFTGRDSLKSMVKWIHANLKDAKTETIQEVAKGEYVWSWMRYTGTSNGVPGMPNGPYDMQAVELAKFKDGKAVEHWNFIETQDMMAMMAQAPPMGNTNMPDSTKK